MILSSRAWQPRSLRQLVFIAFFLIISPIGYMLYKTSNVLESQLQESYRQTHMALQLSQQNNMFERLAEDIVRSATQFRIVQLPAIKERLDEQIENFNNQLSIQMFLSEQNQDRQGFDELFLAVQADPLDETIDTLPQLARNRAEESYRKMEAQLNSIQEQARINRQALWWQTTLLVLATLVLMLYFSAAITRPIAELISRIQAIGRREDLPAAPIRGPMEIVTLNNKILWLDQHLQQLEQVKLEFIQHISHELKTPLTTLREGADLLAEEVPGLLNKQQHHVVSLIQTSSINLQTLIEQLLDYNRLQHMHQLELQKVDIHKAIKAAVTPLQLIISEKSIQLTLPRTSHVIQSDPGMLHRVLGNLVSNAVYYSGQNGHVIIASHLSEKQLIIDVENDGPAIPTGDAEKIFEPFYQGKKRRTGPLKGTGIGLSIAIEASKAMHGKLTLHTNKGGKIVFRLCLPLETI